MKFSFLYVGKVFPQEFILLYGVLGQFGPFGVLHGDHGPVVGVPVLCQLHEFVLSLGPHV